MKASQGGALSTLFSPVPEMSTWHTAGSPKKEKKTEDKLLNK